ncbi:MAG TPA: SCO family protein [Terriglobia bacterium]|nr:SCO family protein [Terriglobia bacterium]
MKRAIIKRLIKVCDGPRHRKRVVVGSKIALVVALAVFCGLGLGAPDARAAASTSSAPQLAQGALPDSARGALNSKQVPALLRGVGIDQRLNQQVPLDLPFRDEFGKTVRLGDFFGKRPVVLSLVYFNCPMLCTMVENNLLQSLRLLKYNVGQQYDVLTVSFDPNDTPLMAANKRRIYVGLYGRKGAAEGWHFLTGDASSIKALTDAVGFHYNYIPQTNQYAHAVGIIVLTPQGKISRYFYGVEYPAGDLRLAIDQASNGKIGSYVDALILYCCEYDANTGKYDLIVNRVLMLGGIVTVLCIGGLILVMSRGGRHHGHGAAA